MDPINSIQQLIILGKGDRGRLEYMLDYILKDKVLPISDQRYLEGLITLYLGSKDSEAAQKNTEQSVEHLYSEVQTLNQRMDKIERKGFERYVGKKTMLFFATIFVGWHALQDFITPTLSWFIPNENMQYLFPLNILAASYGVDQAVLLIFVMMALAWPFIGAIHLAKFIQKRKIVT